MLDIRLLRDDLEQVKKRMATRGIEIDWGEFLSLDRQRRDVLSRLEKLKEQKNRLSGEIGKLKKNGADATELMREVEQLSEEIRGTERPLAEVEAGFEQFMLTVPNLPHADVKVGKNSADNREVRRWGVRPQFDFPARNHWEIGEELDILDFQRAAKLAGARFVIYKGAAARLERALINFMLDLHTRRTRLQRNHSAHAGEPRCAYGNRQSPEIRRGSVSDSESGIFLDPDRRSASHERSPRGGTPT